VKQIDSEKYRLNSGKCIHANNGFLGISGQPENHSGFWPMVEGYDGYLEYSNEDSFTKEERLEIAEFMRDAWTRWANRD